MSAPPYPRGDDAEAENSGEVKSSFLRPRILTAHGPYWDLPEGELATPAQSAEYRRCRRRLILVQSLHLFGFLPLAAWLGFEFLDDLGVRILYFTVTAAVFGYLQHKSRQNFRCPVCQETFPILPQKTYNMSPRRREMSYSRFRWCDHCGARFELYPPSAPTRPEKTTASFEFAAP